MDKMDAQGSLNAAGMGLNEDDIYNKDNEDNKDNDYDTDGAVFLRMIPLVILMQL